MTPPVDPNDVLMTGENSFIRLSKDGGKTPSDRVSHWRVLWCPAGAGHALFVQSERTGGKVRIFTDNEAVTRWLQKTIESLLYPAFADVNQSVEMAEFSRSGGIGAGASEVMVTRDTEIVLSWSDFLPPFVLTMPPGFNDRPIGVFSTFFPARTAQILVNGEAPSGKPWLEKRGDRDAASACLAWSETWVKPR